MARKAKKGVSRFSLKQLWSFILTKTNVMKIDQIEENTVLQPGARILYHGTGDNSDGTVDSGFVYYLSGSDNWVKANANTYTALGEGALLGFAMGTPTDVNQWLAGGDVVVPSEGGMLLRGQVRARVLGNSSDGPFVGSPVWLLDTGAFAGILYHSPPSQAEMMMPTNEKVAKPVGIVLKIIDDDSPMVRHCLIDFSPDHSYTTSPRVTGAVRGHPSNRENGDDLQGLQIINGVIRCTPTIDFTLYLETATTYRAYFPSLSEIDTSMVKFSIINLATGSGGPREGTITLSASADVSIIGSNVIQPSGSGAAGAGTFGLAFSGDVEMFRLA